MPLALSVGEFFKGLFGTLLAAAVFFALLALVISHLRYQFLTQMAVAGSFENMQAEDAFQLKIAQYLGTVHRTPKPFSVGSVRLKDADLLKEELGETLYEEMLEGACSALIASLRESDTVIRYGDGHIGLGVQAPREDIEGAVKRVFEEASRGGFRSAQGDYRRIEFEGGFASFPENGISVRGLVGGAEEALAQVGSSARIIMKEVVETEEEEEFAPRLPPGSDAAQRQSSSLLDPLTGVLRADRLGGAMQKYVARYRKDDKPCSMLYIDIDSLDRYNKHYGPKAGDAIIVEVAKVLEEFSRKEDLIGRVDGEEFILCMGCWASEANAAAHRLAAQIKKTQIPYGTNTLRVTACIGVSGFPDHGMVARQLFDASEAALHSAKLKGRSMTSMFQSGMFKPQQKVVKVDSF